MESDEGGASNVNRGGGKEGSRGGGSEEGKRISLCVFFLLSSSSLQASAATTPARRETIASNASAYPLPRSASRRERSRARLVGLGAPDIESRKRAAKPITPGLLRTNRGPRVDQ